MQHHIITATIAVGWLLPGVVAPAGAQVESAKRLGITIITQTDQDTLRLSVAIAKALAANPSLAAARLEVDAALERVPQSGALADPRVTLALVNRPLGGFGTSERMTMNQVQLSQSIPWPGKRSAAREQAGHLAAAEAEGVAGVEATLISRVTDRYMELAATDRTITIMERTRELLRDFFDVTRSRYEVGESPQQDLLQAQVAVARMTEDLMVMQQARTASAARLNALLGLESETAVGGLELPPIGDMLAPVDSMMAVAVESRPELRSARQRRLAAAAAVRGAERERYPDLTVSLAYGQRPQFGDMATLMVGFTLPVRPGSRQDPLRREMEARESSADARVRELHNATFADLTVAHADAERARKLGTLYMTAILPQARAGVESALSAYRVGQVDYMTLVENEMTVNRYQIELVRTTAEYHQAVARISALLGTPGGNQ